MDTGNNFITRLQEIRQNLLDAVASNRHLATKLVGPRPSDQPKQVGKAPDSIDILLVEINSLAIELVKLTNVHHETVGSFAPVNSGCADGGRAYAS
jgi:hypothetical protein